MSNSSCDALVVSCIDFRFQKYIRNWLDENMANKTFDYVGFAGCTKDLETVLKQIAISVNLHHIKQIVLIHHEDCGAYGEMGTPQKHASDLQKAEEAILKRYPILQVNLFYLHLDGTFEPVQQAYPSTKFATAH